jgi:Leucine-rich repeat (LRR) protein
MDSALPWIKEQSSLTRLSLSFNDATKEGLAHLKDLPHLTHLNLSNSSSKGGCGYQLAGLQGLSSLVSLDLSTCESFTEEGFALLRDLPSLKKLSVRFCPLIKNKGLIALVEQIPSLEKLDISSCKVTSEGVDQLRNLHFLKELNLSHNFISYWCLRRIANTPLESLDITGCYNLSGSEIDKILKFRPNLKIIRSPDLVLS